MAWEATQSASSEWVAEAYPRYRQAALGFRNYWYPAMFSRRLRSKPATMRLLGEEVVLIRDREGVYALQDRCPHRGVPLSKGKSHCPGTLSCAYHGWTYDIRTGELVAALTDRPDSPICGKANVRVPTYPVREVAGLLWVYLGEGTPPPLEADVPDELLKPDIVVTGKISEQKGNWRLAAEAGIDESHGRYLHRWTLFSLLREFPAWTRFRMAASDDGRWLIRDVQEVHFSDEYRVVGRWPRKPAPFYRSRKRGPADVAIKLPGVVRVRREDWDAFEYYVPASAHHRREVLLAVKSSRSRLARLFFKLRYWTYIHWLYFGQFHGQDNWMIERMTIPPERLFGPDESITTWRRMCEREVRSQSTAPEAWKDQEGIVASVIKKGPAAGEPAAAG
jgi:phenylpropionate dioxygenase-like ring-hydroxylating dioxygenase large terminal subunit